ncbi:hypothetical protein ACQEVS_12570 [Streptomyces sp. CA-181903]|uniref:hypothetical protein n=1 Tax=Streptomyces sp. CA-181903 TaxID=3240055 RepID=UPI003D8B8126
MPPSSLSRIQVIAHSAPDRESGPAPRHPTLGTRSGSEAGTPARIVPGSPVPDTAVTVIVFASFSSPRPDFAPHRMLQWRP